MNLGIAGSGDGGKPLIQLAIGASAKSFHLCFDLAEFGVGHVRLWVVELSPRPPYCNARLTAWQTGWWPVHML